VWLETAAAQWGRLKEKEKRVGWYVTHDLRGTERLSAGTSGQGAQVREMFFRDWAGEERKKEREKNMSFVSFLLKSGIGAKRVVVGVKKGRGEGKRG